MEGIDRNQRVLLIVLTLINFFNYLDRQIIFPLFDSLKVEFHVNDFQLGLLGTAFMVVHSVSSLPLGMLADRYSRKMTVAFGVAFWSVLTFATGLVHSFRALLGVRSLVGIGEASYAPAATAMISDSFPEHMRARAQGFFNAGMFVGGTLGAMLGGIIIYYFHSWRLAFFLVAIPGMVLAFAASRVKEEFEPNKAEPIRLRGLFKSTPYVLILTSGVLLTFAVGAYISWGIEFVSRYKGFNLRDASILLGADMMVAGLVGVFLGSYLADKLHERITWGRSIVVAISLILAAPLMYLGLQAPGHNPIFFLYFFLGTALLSFYHGPVTAVLHDLVPKHARATAFAMYILVIHLLGDALAPAVVGYISDKWGLQQGLELMTLLVLIGGIVFLPVSWYMRGRPANEPHTAPARTG